MAQRGGRLTIGDREQTVRVIVPRFKTTAQFDLAQATGVSPSAVAIVRGRRGRPELAEDRGIDFNVSHTAEVALIGITDEGRIGVDVERADRIIQVPGLTRRFLADSERAALPADRWRFAGFLKARKRRSAR